MRTECIEMRVLSHVTNTKNLQSVSKCDDNSDKNSLGANCYNNHKISDNYQLYNPVNELSHLAFSTLQFVF